MRPPLTVSRSPTGFVLRDPALAALLGDPTLRLALPFAPGTDADAVLAHLRRLNPHRDVHLDAHAPTPPASPATARSPRSRPTARGPQPTSP